MVNNPSGIHCQSPQLLETASLLRVITCLPEHYMRCLLANCLPEHYMRCLLAKADLVEPAPITGKTGNCLRADSAPPARLASMSGYRYSLSPKRNVPFAAKEMCSFITFS